MISSLVRLSLSGAIFLTAAAALSQSYGPGPCGSVVVCGRLSHDAARLQMAWEAQQTTPDQRIMMMSIIAQHSSNGSTNWVLAANQYFGWRASTAGIHYVTQAPMAGQPAQSIPSTSQSYGPGPCGSVVACGRLSYDAARLRLAWEAQQTTPDQRIMMMSIIAQYSSNGTTNWAAAANQYFAWRASTAGIHYLPQATTTGQSPSGMPTTSSQPSSRSSVTTVSEACRQFPNLC
jgi:hypothetical protein